MESKLIKEEWKPIAGYDNYMVSNWGRVKSLNYKRTKKEKIINPSKHKKGYLCLNLYKERNKIKIYVHRLVAKAFQDVCGEWFEGCEIDHLNTKRDDNRAENLRVCTKKENCNNPLSLRHYSEKIITEEHRKKISEALTGKPRSEDTKRKLSLAHKGKRLSEETKKKMSIANTNHPSMSKSIVQLDLSGKLIMEYPSSNEAGRKGFSQGSITNCCRGKRNKHHGYRWMYAEDYYAQKQK